jgi:hypothetical protein
VQPKYVRPVKIPLIKKTQTNRRHQTNQRALDDEDIFKDAKEIDSILKRDTVNGRLADDTADLRTADGVQEVRAR